RQLNRPPFRGAPLRACRGASARRGLREKSHLLTCATKSCPTRPPPAIPHRTSSNKTTAKAPQDPPSAPVLRIAAVPESTTPSHAAAHRAVLDGHLPPP